jgi:hypothetical protein
MLGFLYRVLTGDASVHVQDDRRAALVAVLEDASEARDEAFERWRYHLDEAHKAWDAWEDHAAAAAGSRAELRAYDAIPETGPLAASGEVAR